MVLRGILCLSFVVLLAPREPNLGLPSDSMQGPGMPYERLRDTVVSALFRVRADIEADRLRRRH
jgi:hypothetical protein